MMTNISSLISSKKPKFGNALFIAIDGHGGSGKSTFANWLSAKLDAEIIHTDDFASWNNPLNWWSIVIEKVFESIQNGNTVLNYSRSQWWEGHSREPISQPVTNVMILEGVSSLRKEFRKYISIGIFVDTPKSICLQRGIERDLQFGKSETIVRKKWEVLYAEEEKYIVRDDPRSFADVVVDGTVPYDHQIEL